MTGGWIVNVAKPGTIPDPAMASQVYDTWEDAREVLEVALRETLGNSEPSIHTGLDVIRLRSVVRHVLPNLVPEEAASIGFLGFMHSIEREY